MVFPQKRPIDLYIGDPAGYTHELRFMEEDGETPIDITGRDFEMQFREKPETATVLLTMTEGTHDLVNGIYRLHATEATIRTALAPLYASGKRKISADCQEVGGTTLFMSDVNLKLDVTRA